MKKLLSAVMAMLMVMSVFAVSANEAEATEEVGAAYDTMLIEDMEDPYAQMPIEEEGEFPEMPDKEMHHGIVSEVTEEYILLNDGTLRINLAEETYVCDYNLNPAEIKVGDMVSVLASAMMTRSLPPQVAAYFIFVNTENSMAAPIYAVVGSNENGEIMSADGMNRIVYTDETPVVAHRIRMILRAGDITEDSEIVVFATAVGMSLPAHVPAEKIAVLNLAPVKTDVSAVIIDGEEFEIAFNFGSGDARLPLRALAEGLGYEVTWNNEERGVLLTKGEASHTVKIGEALKMARTVCPIPVIENDLTYVGEDIFNLLFGTGAIINFEDGVFNVTTK